MSNELAKVFDFNGNNVRTEVIEGSPWFVAKDICDALGLDNRNTKKVLDEDEVYSVHITDSSGRSQEMIAVNEPGMYSLVLRSRKPEAKAFKRWITHEVLPAIRKTGKFTVDDVIPMLDTITKRLEESENRNDKLQQSVDKLNDNIAIRRYEDPKNRLMAYDTRHGAVMGSRHTRTFYDDIANYLGVDIPKSSMIPKGMFLWEFIVAKYNLDDIESFIVGIEHGTIVRSKAKNWVNLNGYRADRQWNKILESFGHTCAYCGKSHYVSTLVAEHIVPQSTISQFDVDSCNLPSNIVPACSECNYGKFTHPMEMWYKHQPFYDEQRYQKILRHIKKYEVA